MEIELSSREKLLLKYIIEEYIKSITPVGSEILKKNHLNDISSATIRNDLYNLEKKGFIEKTHTSSGRIPSIKGYKYYDENILKPKMDNELKLKLQKVFLQRNLSIESIMNQTTDIINNVLKLPSVWSSFSNEELLKKIDLIQISETTALILVITSSGKINKTSIVLDDKIDLNDISTCIRIFNDRLLNTPVSEIKNKLDVIIGLVSNAIHKYEDSIQEIVKMIFDFNENSDIDTSIKGASWLALQPEFSNKEKLSKVLALLENTNVWKHIAYEHFKSGKTTITFGDNYGNEETIIASANIDSLNDNNKYQLSIISPTRADYQQIKALLNFVNEEIEKIARQKNNEK